MEHCEVQNGRHVSKKSKLKLLYFQEICELKTKYISQKAFFSVKIVLLRQQTAGTHTKYYNPRAHECQELMRPK